MSKIYTQEIKDFSGGMTDEKYLGDFRYARLIKNFDAQTYIKKIIPFRDSESGDNAPTTSQKQNFCIALRTGSTYSLYSLGIVSGGNRAEILYKDLSTGGTTDLATNTWANTSNNQSISGNATDFRTFVFYRNQSRIYGTKTDGSIWVYDPAGSAAFVEAQATLSTAAAATCQGVVHSKDDRLYIASNNVIAVKNAGAAWIDPALTIPAQYIITSLCEYGNYLAIAASPASGIGSSKVFLWDRDTTLATVSEIIDWGEGQLRVLEELDGYLVGISIVGGFTFALKPRHVFRAWGGGGSPTVFKQFVSEAQISTSAANDLPIGKQKVNKELYFMMVTTLNGTKHEGLWKITRNRLGEFTIVMDRTPNNNSALTSGVLASFILVGDFLLFSWSESGTFNLSKTEDGGTPNYNTNSTYQSLIINAGDSSLLKKLISITPTYEAQPTAGSITVGYRKDAETSYTTILTDTTDNAISDSAVNIESSGAILPEFKEIDFQIQSTGNVVITGLKIKYEVLDKNLS